MALGADAKQKMDQVDLYERGRRLIVESVECGVTVIRAHVEVDSVIGDTALDIARVLKAEFIGICDIQIARTYQPLSNSKSHRFSQYLPKNVSLKAKMILFLDPIGQCSRSGLTNPALTLSAQLHTPSRLKTNNTGTFP